jgi:hypothetical protein
MTPIETSFEDRLLVALLDRFDTRAHQPATRPEPSPRRTSIRHGAVAVGCLGAAVSLVVVLEPGSSAPARHVGSTSERGHASTPAYALAAWKSAPTVAGPTQVVAAENHCSTKFGQAALSWPAGEPKGGLAQPGGPWSPELIDTRGDLTLTLYSDASAWTACLSGPSFISINAVSGIGGLPVADNAATLEYLSVRQASGDVYTVAVGESGAGVSGVGLQRTDGSVVAATVGDGHFIAWWPDGEGVSSLAVTTAAGTQNDPVDPDFAQPISQPSNQAVRQLSGVPGH